MKNHYLLYSLLLAVFSCFTYNVRGQVTTDPAYPIVDQPVTFTVDVSGTDLDSYTGDVYIWTWIEKGSNDIDAPTNVNPATSAQSAALMTKVSANTYEITFTPTDFFNQPASQFQQIGLLLKGQDWSDGQTPDYLVDVYQAGLQVSFTNPDSQPLFLDSGDSLNVTATASDAASLNLLLDGVNVQSATSATQINYDFKVGNSGQHTLIVTADDGTDQAADTTHYIVRSATVSAARPAGIKEGINYSAADDSTATLCLLAPYKSSVYVVGDFTQWQVDPAYQMKKDGEHFWLTIKGLTPGKEYAFQYLVDENIYVADPYCDKVLDPDDQYIPNSSYPNLKKYPSEAQHDQWYFNRLSVLQTAQQPYQWQTQNFTPPKKDNLVIYELLIRDFFGEQGRTYKNLADTLSYLSDLGVNAIELMPIMEFNGNGSWGYNPTFMLAPDKYYGPKNELKAFIDKAHQKGIAVILDIAMNHNDIPAPYCMMYFDFNTMKPTAQNPWFNVNATHPYSVFYDFNHESPYTQQFLDSINHYWTHEYKVDGFRYDLSKGFTQKNSGSDVSAWSAYDPSRIAILERMADALWKDDPNAYVILEHFADNKEEKELASYGMMLWGNMNYAYNQCTMGYGEGSDISGLYYGNRDWSQPNLVGYMESHDEERLMYKNETYGNVKNGYSVKNTNTGLERMKAANAFFYTIPGPKMLWEFGEVGYDKSINQCSDGTINDNCRVSAKPVPWGTQDTLQYFRDLARMSLRSYVKALINLKKSYSVFETTDVTLLDNGLTKQMMLKNQNYSDSPADASQMNVVVVGNFDVVERQVKVNFPHNGAWKAYFDPKANTDVSGGAVTLTLKPGEFHLFTDVQLKAPVITGTQDFIKKQNWVIYPNPVSDYLHIAGGAQLSGYKVLNLEGQLMQEGKGEADQVIDVRNLSKGLYLLQLNQNGKTYTTKFLKR